MTSISSLNSQYFAPAASAKPDTASLNQAATTQQQGGAALAAKPAAIETPTTRNSDGTWGPGHLRIKPGTVPANQTANAGAVNSVDIKA